MRPPPADDDLGWTLYSKTKDVLRPSLRELEIERLRNLLRSIVSIDKNEVRTDAVIQKFCYDLQTNGVSVFAPTRLYLGGRWDFLRKDELELLEESGILHKRPSNLKEVNAEVYIVDDNYKDLIDPPCYYENQFVRFSNRCNLKDPFADHDRYHIKNWVTNTDNYLGIDRELFEQARNRDLETDVRVVPDEVSYNSPMAIARTNRVYRPFAAVAYHLVENYKFIPSKTTRRQKTAKFEQSQRMFAPRFAIRQYEENPAKVIGEPVLYVGMLDGNSIVTGDNGCWKQWETPRAETSIPIRFDGVLGPGSHEDIDPYDLLEYSVGILGFLDVVAGELAVKTFAILKSDTLPEMLIDEQRAQTLYGIGAGVNKINEVVEELEKATDQLGDEERRKVRKLMRKLEQATTVATAIDYLLEFKEANPELGWLADFAISYLN